MVCLRNFPLMQHQYFILTKVGSTNMPNTKGY